MLRYVESDRTTTEHYISQLRGRRLLDRDEEGRLARLARAGDRRAMERLIEANLGFVVKVAAEYRNMGLPFEDLLGEGNVGLIEAARRFDADQGTKFITFAVWWVRKAILAALNDHVGVVRVPENHRRKLRRIRDAEQALTGALGRPPERSEVARSLSSSGDRIDDTLRRDPRVRSLTEPAGREGSPPLLEVVADEDASTGEEELLRDEMRTLIAAALSELGAQERLVLDYRFGLSSGSRLALREVGCKLGVSRERVRQIEVKAKGRLRRILERRTRRRLHGGAARLQRAG
jgi:RNA polymerase primary sigma factor